jgi:hypothetical protein
MVQVVGERPERGSLSQAVGADEMSGSWVITAPHH